MVEAGIIAPAAVAMAVTTAGTASTEGVGMVAGTAGTAEAIVIEPIVANARTTIGADGTATTDGTGIAASQMDMVARADMTAVVVMTAGAALTAGVAMIAATTTVAKAHTVARPTPRASPSGETAGTADTTTVDEVMNGVPGMTVGSDHLETAVAKRTETANDGARMVDVERTVDHVTVMPPSIAWRTLMMRLIGSAPSLMRGRGAAQTARRKTESRRH